MQKAPQSPIEPFKRDKPINDRREQRKAKLEALKGKIAK